LGIKCGYKHTAQSIALPDAPPPYHIVYEILRAALPQVQRPIRHHDHLFVAKYVDYLRYTGFHEIVFPDGQTLARRTMYLIAFLDDASRSIIHHRLIADKKSETCCAVLLEALQLWGSPLRPGER
jgi:hypothetical protein